MGKKRVYLSVDFDYFCREEIHWDWGHGENPMFQEIAWQTRTSGFARAGLDFLEETSLERFGHPTPKQFWQKLQELGFRFDEVETVTVQDSHLWAAHDFIERTYSPRRIVNFDAHHDMGYRSWRELKREWLDQMKVDCSNWQLMLLHQLESLEAATVYPKWKGLREIEMGATPWKSSKSISKRYQYAVWDDAYVASLAGDVASIFIAKSSAWMPPWHDQAFVDFVKAAERLVQLEADVPNAEYINPLKCRDFSIEAARAFDQGYVEQLRQMGLFTGAVPASEWAKSEAQPVKKAGGV
jgi:hypothetical protein